MFSWLDALDIAVVATGLYFCLSWLKKVGAHVLGLGLLSLFSIYLLALSLNLRLTVHLFQVFLTVIALILVILFQSELRHFLERLALMIFKKPFARKVVPSEVEKFLETLVSTLTELGEQRIGALVVIQGKVLLDRHTHGGTLLRGNISEAILKSIFDPNSLGHDGALVIVGDALERFGCHLRLSTTPAKGLQKRGTRHAAALGLAEDTDALCLVVSEEKGTLSVAHEQQIYTIKDTAKLMALLQQFYATHYSQQRRRWSWHPPRMGRLLTSLAVSCVLWLFFVHGASIEYLSFDAPVQFSGLEPHLRMENVEPNTVRVIVSAPRRVFNFHRDYHPELNVRLLQNKPGEYEQLLVASDLDLPDGMQFENIWPRNVHFYLKDLTAANSATLQ